MTSSVISGSCKCRSPKAVSKGRWGGVLVGDVRWYIHRPAESPEIVRRSRLAYSQQPRGRWLPLLITEILSVRSLPRKSKDSKRNNIGNMTDKTAKYRTEIQQVSLVPSLPCPNTSPLAGQCTRCPAPRALSNVKKADCCLDRGLGIEQNLAWKLSLRTALRTL
jgi:hypothetical protein